MNYSIEEKDSGLKITAEQLGDKQSQLMKELKKCAEGHCSCPTPQYAKLESIEVKPGVEKVEIALKAKPGEKIDQADINRCLEEMSKKLAHGS